MFANNYRPWRDGFLLLPFLSCHPTPLLGLRGHGRTRGGGGFAWFNTVSHESNISLYINYRQLKGEKMEWKVERDDGMEVDASNNGSSFLPEIDPEDRSRRSRSNDDG